MSGGVVTTIAGNGACAYSGDNGPATSVGLSSPSAIAIDSAGALYIAEKQGQCRIRKVVGDTITAIAGNGVCGDSGDGGPATKANLNAPGGIAVDSTGALYISETFVYGVDQRNCRVRKVVGGTIMTIAGNGTCGFSGDGGPATSASINWPSRIAVGSTGDLYIADQQNCRIRKVSAEATTTIAGTGACDYGALGDQGPAIYAILAHPSSVAVDAAGNVFINDTGNCRIRKVSGGMITTVAGNGICVPASVGVHDTLASRDARRKVDLQRLVQAAQEIKTQLGSYPTTRGGVQTLCTYERIDMGCKFRPYMDGALPADHFGNGRDKPYYYSSDGATARFYASLEETVRSPDQRCITEGWGSSPPPPNLICVTAP